jgi:LPS export ABC transporter protein LptC
MHAYSLLSILPLKKMKKNPLKNQLRLETQVKNTNFTTKMLRWVNTTSAKMQMGDKLLSPFCFCILLLLFIACQEEKNKPQSITYRGPLEEAENIEVLYSEAGQLKVKVKTAKQIKLPSEDKFFPKKVFVDFYAPTGQVTTTLESDSGRYEYRTGLYFVKGNVKVVNTQKQERLFTDELTWNPHTQKVYTEKKVVIESQTTGERINGVGLDANQDFTQYSIRKPTGFFNAPAGFSSN